MTVPVLTFFNNKGGVGKTSLVYHLAWILSKMNINVLVCDLDPQANLTAYFLDDDKLEDIWIKAGENEATTIYKAVRPLTDVGDVLEPTLVRINRRLHLIPGDLDLSGFEDTLSESWSKTLADDPKKAFRVMSAFWRIAQQGAHACKADLILFDVGPNLGAINRSALIATDHVIVPLGADLFSLQGLKNLGPTLRRWRDGWSLRAQNWNDKSLSLPVGKMHPLGYVIQQHSLLLKRPVKAYKRWVDRIPGVYSEYVLDKPHQKRNITPTEDADCMATIKHYRSLIALAQEARKPIFDLTSADGAIGAHAAAVSESEDDFRKLAARILDQAGLDHLDI
jgi:chromosome partitioning protein